MKKMKNVQNGKGAARGGVHRAVLRRPELAEGSSSKGARRDGALANHAAHILLALLAAALVLLSATPARAQARIGTDLCPMLTGSPNLTIEAPLAGRIFGTFNARAIGMQGMGMPKGVSFRTGIAARPIPALSLGIGWSWSRESLTTSAPEVLQRLRCTKGISFNAGWRLNLSSSIGLEPNIGIGKYYVAETVTEAIEGFTNNAKTATYTVTPSRWEFLPTHLALGKGYGLSGGITLTWAIPQQRE